MIGTADQVVYLFGDSITQHGFDPSVLGWVSSLSHAYMRRMTVVNAGLSGYSSDQAIDILPRMLPSPQQANIRILAVFFGANDARLPGSGDDDSPDQHVPPELYKQNLRRIVTHPLVRAHKPKIVLITPPPIDEHLLVRKNRTAAVAARYAEQARALSKELAAEGELNIRCLDIWTAFSSKCGWTPQGPLLGAADVAEDPVKGLPSLLSDGLHFNAGGNQLLFEEFSALVKREWPELAPEALPFTLPVWLDPKAWKHVFDARQ